MSLKRQIKTQLIVFVVILTAFVATFLYLFQENYHQFKEEIYKRSKANLEIIDALSKVDTNLYIHKKSLFRYLNTGDPKWLTYLKDAESGIDKQFQFMEEYNKSEFNLWVTVQNYYVRSAKKELEKQIIEFQKGRSGDDHFQRLFYLTRYNIGQYFRQADELIKKNSSVDTDELTGIIDIDDEENYVKLIYVGINQLVTVYNNLFWDYAQTQNSRYNKNTNYYFRTLMISSVFVLLFAVFILMRVLRYFYTQQLRNENLALLGAKDLVTGLFNKRSFEILCSQEMERAKRRGYHLSLLVVRVGPYDDMKKDLGEMSVNRIMFQVSELLKQAIRSYDGIYKYDENTFIVLFSETDFPTINAIVKRIKKRFHKTAFLVKKDKTEVLPRVSTGFAIYPTDADNLNGIVQFAMGNLSTTFDAYDSHKPEAAPVLINKQSVDDQFQQPTDVSPAVVPAQVPLELKTTTDHEDARFVPPHEPDIVVDDNPWIKQELEKHEEAAGLDDLFVGSAKEPIPEVPVAEVPIAEVPIAEEPIAEEPVAEVPVAEEPVAEVPVAEVPVAEEPIAEEPLAEEIIEPQIVDDVEHEEIVDEDGIPDIVAALSQEEVESESPDVDFAKIIAENDAPKRPLPEIEIVHPGEGEDVIMVDFDREEDDLAMNFRKRLLEQRKKA